MVGSAVLGAATGTGLALVVAMTIVIYRYYTLRRRAKEWGSIDERLAAEIQRPVHLVKKGVRSNTKYHANIYALPRKEFSVPKEQHVIQPPSQGPGQSMTAELMRAPLDVCPSMTGTLQHQSKSYPTGQPRLVRTPSISSQSSFDSSVSRQGHRGSSPQIRTYAPDGRTSSPQHHVTHEGRQTQLHGGSSSRSPSPLRTSASLDTRCQSPATASTGSGHSVHSGELRTSSPSQTSLASLTGGSASSMCSATSGPMPASPRSGSSISRCLSPLLLPPKNLNLDSTSPGPPASPLGTLQPDLYQKRDGPLFLRNRSRTGNSLGRLHLRLKYDFDRSDLAVHLIEAHDLAGSDQGGFNDPYVRISMIPPVDNRKRQTTIHRNDPNPFFDQQFKFPVSHDDLQDKTLVLQVFDYDRFSRNDVIGEVRMTMDEFDVTSSIEVWGEITKNKKPPEELQEILLSLSYLPSAERLTVVLLKARNLFLPDEKDSIDPFVKVNLIVNGKRVKKKKTAPRKGSCNPVWNEALNFSLAAASLPQAAIEICVLDQASEFISSNPLLGCCIIGPREDGSAREHWLDMIQSPRKAVASWHILR